MENTKQPAAQIDYWKKIVDLKDEVKNELAGYLNKLNKVKALTEDNCQFETFDLDSAEYNGITVIGINKDGTLIAPELDEGLISIYQPDVSLYDLVLLLDSVRRYFQGVEMELPF